MIYRPLHSRMESSILFKQLSFLTLPKASSRGYHSLAPCHVSFESSCDDHFILVA